MNHKKEWNTTRKNKTKQRELSHVNTKRDTHLLCNKRLELKLARGYQCSRCKNIYTWWASKGKGVLNNSADWQSNRLFELRISPSTLVLCIKKDHFHTSYFITSFTFNFFIFIKWKNLNAKSWLELIFCF